MLYFVENITFTTGLFYIFPFLFRRYFSGDHGKSKLYFIDGSKGGILIARFLSLINIQTEKLLFSLTDIRDDSGPLPRLRIAYQDLAEIQEKILKNRPFQEIFQNKGVSRRAAIFIAKSIGYYGSMNSRDRTVWRAIFLVDIALWKVKKEKAEKACTILFMARRPWLREIQGYARQYGIKVVPFNREYIVVRPKELIRRLREFLPSPISSRIIRLISFFYYTRNVTIRHFKQVMLGKLGYNKVPQSAHTAVSPRKSSDQVVAKLAVEYYGHFNLSNPEQKSDLFFWQESKIHGEDILITFAIPTDPLSEAKWSEITKHGMVAVALNALSITTPNAPVFQSAGRGKRKLPRLEVSNAHDCFDAKFLLGELSRYYAIYDYWREFFEKHHVKLYTSWYKYDGTHCAIADALKDLGGISTIYQRAFEEFPSPETTVATDVVFGFSHEGAEIERRQHSLIPYYVVTGYIGDHRTALLRENALTIRTKLQQRGASHILAFFDENTAEDSRWWEGHDCMQEDYLFLLEKVLSEPWFGLVIKPKTPSTLRRRLGDVAGLLKQAEETGRCFIWEEGAIQGSYPPAVAALASDVAVHGHLSSATAGLEAALTGVPTLLLDRDGWSVSKLYGLGKGRVVFNEWQVLWEACQDQWSTSSGRQEFGDWSPMLDDLDPFRDGCAAERMGTYLKWLIDDLKAGHSRAQALANAAERYCEAWGQDKIIEIKTELNPYVKLKTK